MKRFKRFGAVLIATMLLFTLGLTAFAATLEELEQELQVAYDALVAAEDEFSATKSLASDAQAAYDAAVSLYQEKQAAADSAADPDEKEAKQAEADEAALARDNALSELSLAEAAYSAAELKVNEARTAYDNANAAYQQAAAAQSSAVQSEISSEAVSNEEVSEVTSENSSEEEESNAAEPKEEDEPQTEAYTPVSSTISMIFPEGAESAASRYESSAAPQILADTSSQTTLLSSSAPTSSTGGAVNTTGKKFLVWGIIFIVLAVLSLLFLVYYIFLREKLQGIFHNDSDDEDDTPPTPPRSGIPMERRSAPQQRPPQSYQARMENGGAAGQRQADYFGLNETAYRAPAPRNDYTNTPQHTHQQSGYRDINPYAQPDPAPRYRTSSDRPSYYAGEPRRSAPPQNYRAPSEQNDGYRYTSSRTPRREDPTQNPDYFDRYFK